MTEKVNSKQQTVNSKQRPAFERAFFVESQDDNGEFFERVNGG